MLKKLFALAAAALLTIGSFTLAYADSNITPKFKINDSQLTFSLEGKTEHIYIVRLVVGFSSSAGLGNICAADDSIIKYNCNSNSAVILYFNREGGSLNGKKDYIKIDLTNGSYGNFYVSDCEIVKEKNKVFSTECCDKITVNKDNPVKSIYNTRLIQNTGEGSRFDVTDENLMPEIELPLSENIQQEEKEKSERKMPDTGKKPGENTVLIFVTVLIATVVLLKIINSAYKYGKRSAMKNSIKQNSTKEEEDSLEEQNQCNIH